jgi:crossover junction endodeoxyribonuclease RuvC
MAIHVGIDIGYATLGWGVVKRNKDGSCEHLAHGIITTSPKDHYVERLKQLGNEVTNLVEAWKPDQIAIEKPDLRTTRCGFEVVSAFGAVSLALYEFGAIPLWVTPGEVKKIITGKGNTPKPAMRDVMKARFDLATMHPTDDAWDGLAIAVTIGDSDKIKTGMNYS